MKNERRYLIGFIDFIESFCMRLVDEYWGIYLICMMMIEILLLWLNFDQFWNLLNLCGHEEEELGKIFPVLLVMRGAYSDEGN